MKEEQRLRISVSFRNEYRHLYDHVIKQANSSDYICRVLQKELEREQNAKRLEDKLEDLLSAINTKGILFNSNNGTAELEQSLNDEDINLINQLF
ncbi:hypothetical protein [Alkalihalobacterium bogoriense]|uniref:hypothetical protein n=1 Tax=Alkalihalobacterium bogoriense TaxID=246272 RepID=UPI00047CF9BC|nr:hypothetical protein [Alkalihalobacterium bogoriense]